MEMVIAHAYRNIIILEQIKFVFLVITNVKHAVVQAQIVKHVEIIGKIYLPVHV
jgi:hypothetical protein